MRYRILLNSQKHKTRTAIDLLGFMLPFSDLSGRERDVLAEYIDGYFEFRKKDLTEDEIFSMLFDYNFTRAISDVLSTPDKPVTIDSIRNYVTKLRKKGLIKEQSINKDFLNLFGNMPDNITFVFEIKK